MAEVFPVMMGALIGAAVQFLAPARLRIAALLVLGTVAGVAASALSGELEISVGFILIDVGQVALIGALTMAAIALWQRRSARV